MKLDESKRELLEKKKEDEKQEAVKQIFSDHPSTEHGKEGHTLIREDSKPSQDETIQNDSLAKSSNKASFFNEKPSKKANEIWDENSINDGYSDLRSQGISSGSHNVSKPQMMEGDASEERPKTRVIPGVRNTSMQETVKLEFTEKIFPTLALRESQFKEAPAPKLRKLAKKMDQVP